MGIFSFYRACFVRAFTGKFFLVEKWSGGLGLLSALAAKFFPATNWRGGMLTEDLPMYFFLFVFLVTVFLGFVTAPYSIYKEQLDKAILLEQSRKPKLKVFIGEAVGTKQYTAGTGQSFSGSRSSTLYHSRSNALSLVVKNVGEVRAETCTASLIWAECVHGDRVREIDIFEPIKLPWSHANTEENLQISLDPSESCRVWIADVTHKGFAWVMRETKNLPANYQQVFGPSGRYRAIIQVSDGKSLSIETRIEIVCSEGEPTAIYPNGVGKGSISILEQDYQPLLRSSTAT